MLSTPVSMRRAPTSRQPDRPIPRFPLAKLELSEAQCAKLGPEHKMDVHWVDVKLRDGRKRYRMAVRGGRYVTGDGPNGEGDLDFESADIVELRPAALFRWWPIW
jgi:hypothetical protein